MTDSGQASFGSAAPFDVGALQAYLHDRVPGLTGEIRLTRFKGGQSNPTYLVESDTKPDVANPDVAKRFVLRSKPAPRADLLPSAHAIEREFRVQSALAGSEVPVAGMQCLCEDESVIGRAFYLMDHIEGRIFWDQTLPELDSAGRAAIYDELNRVIAALHRVDPDSIGLGEYGKHGNYFSRQIERWTRQYSASRTLDIAAMDKLVDWLPAHIPDDDDPVALVHGDYRIDNVIFHPSEPRILAVIDWELSTLGHPLADFAYHMMAWHIPHGTHRGLAGLDLSALGIPHEPAYVAAYQQRSGRTVSGDWNFYLAYNLFRVAAICQGIAKRAEDGTASSARAAEFGKQAQPLAELGWQFARLAGAR